MLGCRDHHFNDDATDHHRTAVADHRTPSAAHGPDITGIRRGDPIPAKFSCDGQDISPELQVISLPVGTVTLALIVDDPDAPVGTWDHWVEFDIEIESENQLWPEDVVRLGVRGVNSWNLLGYGGPCPPQGENHRYFFTVFALDTELLIPEGVDSDALRLAMEGHTLGEAQLMGTYGR